MLKFKIINYLIKHGKKSISEKIFLKVFKNLQLFYKKNSKLFFKFSFVFASPIVYLQEKRRKKKILQEIPFLLKPSIRIFYSIKEIKNKKNQSKKFFDFLFFEIISNLLKTNENYLNKNLLYKKVFSKKLYSHYRWF